VIVINIRHLDSSVWTIGIGHHHQHPSSSVAIIIGIHHRHLSSSWSSISVIDIDSRHHRGHRGSSSVVVDVEVLHRFVVLTFFTSHVYPVGTDFKYFGTGLASL